MSTPVILLPLTLALLLASLTGAAFADGPAPQPPHLGPVLTLDQTDLTRDPLTGRLTLSASALPPPAINLPTIERTDTSPPATYLRHLVAIGQAAGLAGVVYDNLDRGHSHLPPTLFPALTRTAYGPKLHAKGFDFGPDGAIRLPAITFGNSSTAITSGPAPRSLTRLEMTMPGRAWQAWDDYSSNALYIYPCVNDHLANDLYPAAWPYTLTSQGRSGSDKPFLRAVAMIIAAFPPDTRAKLKAEGLVAPTVQMVFRRAQTGVNSRADYLSGAAHPSAFVASAVNLGPMISLANSLSPTTIPPLVRLSVESEDFLTHVGLLGRSEKLFDTPSAIARLWRDPAWQHQMVVSTAGTADPNGRPLKYIWVLLRGDPARVKIQPLDTAGSTARITLDWQTARPAPAGFTVKGPGPMSSRVDIGVFANNGATLSAPAFISVDFPTQQIRRYEPGPDGRMRLAEINYDANGRKVHYDPLIWWSAPWRDVFRYDAKGQFDGWIRFTTRANGPSAQAFAANGTEGGNPIRYVLKRPGADLAMQRN